MAYNILLVFIVKFIYKFIYNLFIIYLKYTLYDNSNIVVNLINEPG